MRKRLFVVSDIHGSFFALEKSLSEAGFNEKDPNHLLVSCGDAFDRGAESLAVYQYLKRLNDEGKAIILRGNHTTMLQVWLNGSSVNPWNYIYNGTNETLADFLHQSKPFESWCILDKKIEQATSKDFAEWINIAKNEINEEYPELLPWLESLPYYYETENYIFTHAAIDTEARDWHNPENCSWEDLVWDEGGFFGKTVKNTEKTIVIGHFGTQTLRKKYNIDRDAERWSTLKRKDGKVIAIDATTPYSHKVNVLVIDDELIN